METEICLHLFLFCDLSLENRICGVECSVIGVHKESNATADVPWDEYINCIYHSAWGVCVARFDISGNAKALQSGASDKASAPRSFCVCPEPKTKTSA